MNKKIVFFDIDGTLLSETTHKIPESAISAIHEMQKKGHLAFINTGRTFAFLDDAIMEIGFDGFLCGCGTYIQYQNRSLSHHKLPDDLCKKIVLLLRECELDAILEGKEKSYGETYERVHSQIFRDFIDQYQYPYDTWDAKDLSFDKFFMYAGANEKFQRFKSELQDMFEFIDREHGFYEVVPKGYSKASAMKEIAELLQIELENTIAIGDSNNDLAMLAMAGTSIAMGNSSKNLLDKVDYVTADVDDDGIYKALAYYKLI